jgi:MscS family membrane protein
MSLLAVFVSTWLIVIGASTAADTPDVDKTNPVPKDAQVPGALRPEERMTGASHPISVVEHAPPLSDPTTAVLPQALNSPRDLMWSLGRALNAYRVTLETEGRTFENQQKLDWIQDRIAYCFDLSDIAPEFRGSTAIDAAVRLQSMMRRVPLPAWKSIPGAEEIAKMPESARPKWYRYQDVPIQLIQLDSGGRAGKWVISKETRNRAKPAFNRVRHLKPIAGSGDLFRLHFFGPGWLIPSSFIRSLPSWTGYNILDQSIWQWTVALVAALILFSALLVIFILTHRRLKRPLTIRGRIISLLFLLLMGIAMVFLEYFVQHHVFLHGLVLEIFALTAAAIMTTAFVCAILTLGVLVAELVIASPRINPKSLDAALIRVATRAISILIAAIIFFQILSQIGFSPTTILAGAGVTGLAFALAAQDTLKNFFASIILLLERPFREGDYVRVGNDFGRVESIGLRSTCLQIGKGNLVYLPNEDVAHGRIENVSRRPHIRCDLTIGVTYSTPHAKLTRAVEIIREILNDKVESPPDREPLVVFSEFADSSLVIKCRYWQSTTDYTRSQEISQDVNLAILERFNEEGLEFAFPTMTLEMDGETITDSKKLPTNATTTDD